MQVEAKKRTEQELAGVQLQITTDLERLGSLTTRITGLSAQLVQVESAIDLQESGIYQYLHPLDDAVAYKTRLAVLQDTCKAMVRAGTAVRATTNWTINGSTTAGTAMVRDFSKLMLRAYNAEADNAVRTVRPYKVSVAVDRLTKVRETIAKLGRSMDIRIDETYHLARVNEIALTADYLGKVAEEKERVREQRERQREEDKAKREFEQEKARLTKEQSHYSSALAKLRARGDVAAVAELEAKLEEIGAAILDVEAREANVRAGYVYVISNVGAFGPDMIKVGMTRRLEPQDRVRELGDASVPFLFDTHALIFSADAVGLEARLHAELEAHRVNHVNRRREFFYATPAQVRTILERIDGPHLLEFHEAADAVEWRASGRPPHAAGTPA